LIKSKTAFQLYVLFTGRAKKLQAGTYLFSSGMSMSKIAKILSQGKIATITITIPEGYNLGKVENLINEKFKIKNSKLQFKIKDYKIKDFQEEFDFLKNLPTDVLLEGFLFPDTYRIPLQADSREIVRLMLKNFGEKIKPLQSEIEKQGKTLFEIITMASLIEKEVQSLEDKKIVSDILWKRLTIKMPLQVDATITYITGKKTVKISYQELQIENPYNTYKYLGLPPGPIANPGIESIKAAIFPKKTDYWYYLSTPDSKTIFSKTLFEHNLAKAKYLRE
jgi:UPF0755 protein